MAPSASIIFPTRDRRDYLAVALASVAPQARAHGAEILVVEDDPADPETARAGRATRRALRRPRPRRCGINRRAQHGHRPGRGRPARAARRRRRGLARLARGAARAARASTPEHEALGGPIRARLEQHQPARLRARAAADHDARPRPGRPRRRRRVGREPGPAPRGARARSAASTRALDLGGDEEDWQRRLRAAGGRIRYVAAAGVDHRRAGARRPARPRSPRAALPPRPRTPGATTRCKRAEPPLARRAARARRLRLAHRPPPLRQRDRAGRAHRRAAAGGAQAEPARRRGSRADPD